MRTSFFRGLPTLLLLTTLVTACSGGGGSSSGSSPQWGQGLEQLKSVVAEGAGYSRKAIDVTASPFHVRISVVDAHLAQADQLTRENAASVIVSVAEGYVYQHGQFASVQVISVAIVHPAQADGTAAETHTEDVLEFRKGPNQRFAHHIT